HRGGDCPGIGGDKGAGFRRGHKAVRVGPPIGKARQPGLPVGSEQAQGVPALPVPGIGNPPPLQHQVVDGQGAEAVTHGQPGVASADHHRGYRTVHFRPDGGWVGGHFTATCTEVGLVMMSNTAERFWDWATRARISSRPASASTTKVTLTSSKPLRTSLSTPRIPCRSMVVSRVAVTECSWMP